MTTIRRIWCSLTRHRYRAVSRDGRIYVWRCKRCRCLAGEAP